MPRPSPQPRSDCGAAARQALPKQGSECRNRPPGLSGRARERGRSGAGASFRFKLSRGRRGCTRYSGVGGRVPCFLFTADVLLPRTLLSVRSRNGTCVPTADTQCGPVGGWVPWRLGGRATHPKSSRRRKGTMKEEETVIQQYEYSCTRCDYPRFIDSVAEFVYIAALRDFACLHLSTLLLGFW